MLKEHKETESRSFVCLATGDIYNRAEAYIERMYSMLERTAPQPFTLTCITDKPRGINPAIIQIDCSQWKELRRPGMRSTTLKIGLFNESYLPNTDFIYLDLTLIIRRNLSSLLEYMDRQSAPLVIVKDWHYDTYNSCVMRIKNKQLNFIYTAFASGASYRQKTPGDQDFIHSVIAEKEKQHLVSLIPAQMVCSLKQATRAARHDAATSCNLIENATIVKFHGNPKMHEFFDRKYQLMKYGFGHLRYGKWGLPFDVKALNEAWRGGEK